MTTDTLFTQVTFISMTIGVRRRKEMYKFVQWLERIGSILIALFFALLATTGIVWCIKTIIGMIGGM